MRTRILSLGALLALLTLIFVFVPNGPATAGDDEGNGVLPTVHTWPEEEFSLEDFEITPPEFVKRVMSLGSAQTPRGVWVWADYETWTDEKAKAANGPTHEYIGGGQKLLLIHMASLNAEQAKDRGLGAAGKYLQINGPTATSSKRLRLGEKVLGLMDVDTLSTRLQIATPNSGGLYENWQQFRGTTYVKLDRWGVVKIGKSIVLVTEPIEPKDSDGAEEPEVKNASEKEVKVTIHHWAPPEPEGETHQSVR